MSEKQKIGQALERLTYDTLKDLLRDRLRTKGTAHASKYGMLWKAANYIMFWNSQVVKEGEYSEYSLLTIPKTRLADIVLCDNYRAPYNWDGGLPDPTAILAIELKNMNLQFQWTGAWMFDRDIVSQFVRGNPADLLCKDYAQAHDDPYNLFPAHVGGTYGHSDMGTSHYEYGCIMICHHLSHEIIRMRGLMDRSSHESIPAFSTILVC